MIFGKIGHYVTFHGHVLQGDGDEQMHTNVQKEKLNRKHTWKIYFYKEG